MKKRLLSLIACALIACNLITSISYAAEIEDAVDNEQEISEEENIEVVDDTDIEQIEESDSLEETLDEEKFEEEVDEGEELQEEETIVEDNLSLEEEIEEVEKEFVVTFVDSIDDTEFATFTVHEGESVEELPEAPVHEGYEFEEYSGNYTNVISDEKVTAIYSPLEKENEFTYKELSCDLEGYSISVIGNMPEDTELQASIISNNEAEEQVEAELNGTFKAEVTFDIKLISEGTDYQPTDFDEEVKVSIKGIDSEKYLDVFRITDDGIVTDMKAVDSGDEVCFETDHFTTYTVGDIEYASTKIDTWLGLTVEYYDTDNDGKEETCVLSGTQIFPYVQYFNTEEELFAADKAEERGSITSYTTKPDGKEIECVWEIPTDTISKRPWSLHTDIKEVIFKDAKLISLAGFFDLLSSDGMYMLESIKFENVDTSELTDMRRAFMWTLNLRTIDWGDNFDTSNVTNMSQAFWACAVEDLDLSSWNTSKVTDFYGMFYLPQAFWHHSFKGDWKPHKTIDVSSFDTSSATTFQEMFYYNEYVEELDLSNWDTSKVTNMEKMFEYCLSLKNLKGLKGFNTSSVTTMLGMFGHCAAPVIDVSSFDTSNVKIMREMFEHYNGTLIGVEKLNTSNVTDMEGMFESNYSRTSLDLSAWDTSSLEYMNRIFKGCQKLETLDVSTWDTSNVVRMYAAFGECSELKNLDVSNWDVSSCLDFESTFADMEKLETLDLSNWNMTKAINISRMFNNCYNMKSIKLKKDIDMPKLTTATSTFSINHNVKIDGIDVSSWNVPALEDCQNMFNADFEYIEMFPTDNISKLSEENNIFGTSEYSLDDDKDNIKDSSDKYTSLILNSASSHRYIPYEANRNTVEWLSHNQNKLINLYVPDKDGKFSYSEDMDYPNCKVISYVCDNIEILDVEILNPEDTAKKDVTVYFVSSLTGECYEKIQAKRGSTIKAEDLPTPPEVDGYIVDSYGYRSVGDSTIVTAWYQLKENSFSEDMFIDIPVGDMYWAGNVTGKAYLYTIRINGTDTFKCLAGGVVGTSGIDGTFDTDDDFSYWYSDAVGYFVYPNYNNKTAEELYEVYKDFFIDYATKEPMTLDKNEWLARARIYDSATDDYTQDESQISWKIGYSFRLASYELIFEDADGNTVDSTFVEYGTDITDILAEYDETGYDVFDIDGSKVTSMTMPLNKVTLTLKERHVHTPKAAVIENKVNPTCTTDGSYDEVVYCSSCNEVISTTHKITQATGHTSGEAFIENKKNASHTKDGYYDSVIYCKDCGEELSRETITIPATDHNPATAVVENRVEPTCTEAGHYDSVIYCKDDGDELSRTTVELEPTGHVGSNAVKENIVNATEDEEGSYEEVVYCAHCNKELSRESKTIAKIEVIISVPSEPTDPVDPIIPDRPSTEDNTPENPSDEEPSNPIEAIEEEPQEIEVELETEEEVVPTISTDRTGSYSAGSEDDLEFKTVEIIAMAEDEDIDNNAETKTVTVKEPEEESDEIAEVIKAVVVTLSVAGSSGGIFFVFIWFRRRKVKGKILSKDGIDYAGCLVTLEGKDKLRTRTNKNGEFTFRNLKKDTYVLTVFNESKEILFSCELLLSNKNSANSVPNVLENNALSYQYAVAGASYILDIFA